MSVAVPKANKPKRRVYLVDDHPLIREWFDESTKRRNIRQSLQVEAWRHYRRDARVVARDPAIHRHSLTNARELLARDRNMEQPKLPPTPSAPEIYEVTIRCDNGG